MTMQVAASTSFSTMIWSLTRMPRLPW